MEKECCDSIIRRNVFYKDCENCAIRKAYSNVFNKPTYDTDDAMIIFFVRNYCCEKISSKYVKQVKHCPRYSTVIKGGL